MLVSTYIKHGLGLTALLSSLLMTGYPYLDIILLDTDVNLDSSKWMQATARVLNSRSNKKGKRNVVHISARTQRDVKRDFDQIQGPDYG